MGGYINDRNIKPDAGLSPTKLNQCTVESFKAPAAGGTDGATAVTKDFISGTDASSGSLAFTAGSFAKTVPDVPRGLEIYVEGTPGTSCTGGHVLLHYKTPSGRVTSKAVTGLAYTAGTTGQARFPLPAGIAQLVSPWGSGVFAGSDLTGLTISIGQAPTLAIANQPGPHSHIVHESGQATIPELNKTTGLFTPVTTLNGSNNVEIRVHYGSSR